MNETIFKLFKNLTNGTLLVVITIKANSKNAPNKYFFMVFLFFLLVGKGRFLKQNIQLVLIWFNKKGCFTATFLLFYIIFC